MRGVIIMRGLPGSGKSTVARGLAESTPGAVIVSADNFFNGGPIEVRALGHAHAWCQRQFVDCLKDGVDLVIVDNTNTTAAEIRFYHSKAVEFGYEVTILEVPCDIETSASRNVHSVPRETIEQMANRMATSPLDPTWQVVRYGG